MSTTSKKDRVTLARDLVHQAACLMRQEAMVQLVNLKSPSAADDWAFASSLAVADWLADIAIDRVYGDDVGWYRRNDAERELMLIADIIRKTNKRGDAR